MTKTYNLLLTKNRHGLTLLEVMVSMTIMTFLMLGMYSMVSGGSATKDRVLREDRYYLQVQTALYRINQDFIQIYSPLYYSYLRRDNRGSEAQNQDPALYVTESFPRLTHNGLGIPLFFVPKKDQLTFFTSSNRRKVQNNKESRYAWVSYSLEENPDETQKGTSILVRRVLSQNPYDENILQNKDFTEQKLLDNISSLHFQFWDSEKKEFLDFKNLGRNRNSYLGHPFRAIKTLLVRTDEQGNRETFERISRPLYPFFDVQKDEKDRERITQEWKGDNKSDQIGQNIDTRNKNQPRPNRSSRDQQGPTGRNDQ